MDFTKFTAKGSINAKPLCASHERCRPQPGEKPQHNTLCAVPATDDPRSSKAFHAINSKLNTRG